MVVIILHILDTRDHITCSHFLYLPFDFKDHQCYNMHQRSIHVYTVSVGHICLSIHPLTQSGSFHPLTIMNKDVVNTMIYFYMHVYLQLPRAYTQECWLIWSLCLMFWGSAQLFYIPNVSFLYPLKYFILFLFLKK